MINILLNAILIIIAIILLIVLGCMLCCIVIPAFVILTKKIFNMFDKLSDKMFKKEHK